MHRTIDRRPSRSGLSHGFGDPPYRLGCTPRLPGGFRLGLAGAASPAGHHAVSERGWTGSSSTSAAACSAAGRRVSGEIPSTRLRMRQTTSRARHRSRHWLTRTTSCRHSVTAGGPAIGACTPPRRRATRRGNREPDRDPAGTVMWRLYRARRSLKGTPGGVGMTRTAPRLHPSSPARSSELSPSPRPSGPRLTSIRRSRRRFALQADPVPRSHRIAAAYAGPPRATRGAVAALVLLVIVAGLAVVGIPSCCGRAHRSTPA